MTDLSFVWLEITGTCQLTCAHCYADSGPTETEGTMTSENWSNVIDQAVGLGTRTVQFIGGEPTLNRDLPRLIEHALRSGAEVEVFSNLVHVPPALWDVFEQPGVRLATSYYSDNAEQHEAITNGRGSYSRTKANIAEALRRSIPLRVGVIEVEEGQRVAGARHELAQLGVLEEVRVDHLRQVGRGVRDRRPNVDQLCGNCVRGTLAVSPRGRCLAVRVLPVVARGERPARGPCRDHHRTEDDRDHEVVGREFRRTTKRRAVRSTVRAELRTGMPSAMLAHRERAVWAKGWMSAQL